MKHRIKAAVALLDESALLLSGRGQRRLAAALDEIAQRAESGPTLEFATPQGSLILAADDPLVVQQFPADAALPYDCFVDGERPVPAEPPFGERQDCTAEEALALIQQGLQVFRLDPATNQFCRLQLPLPLPSESGPPTESVLAATRRVRAAPSGNTLVLRIDSLDNDAFVEDPGQEIARIVRAAAAKVKNGNDDFRLFDGNGNRVGSVSLDGPTDGAALLITIDLANAAFGGGWGRECARILQKAAGRLEGGAYDFKLMDVNGNGVGRCVTAAVTVAIAPQDMVLRILEAPDAQMVVSDSGHPDDGPMLVVKSSEYTKEFSNNPQQQVRITLARGTTAGIKEVTLAVSPYPSWSSGQLSPALTAACADAIKSASLIFGTPDNWQHTKHAGGSGWQRLVRAATQDEIADPLGSPALVVITEDPQVGALDADYFRTEGVGYFVLEQQRLTGEAIYAKIAEANPDTVLDLVCSGSPPAVGQDVLTACGLESVTVEPGTAWYEVQAHDVQRLLADDQNATGHEQTAAESLARMLVSTTAPVVRPVTAAAEITLADLTELYRRHVSPEEIRQVYSILQGRSGPLGRLAQINDIVGGHGIEGVTAPRDRGSNNPHTFSYINEGDTYTATLGYDSEEGFMICSWGDWMEGLEHDFHEENPPSYGVGVVVEFADGAEGDACEKVVDELLSKVAARDTESWGDPWDAEQKFVFEYESHEAAKSEARKIEDQIRSAAGAAGVKLSSLWVGPVARHHYQTSEEMDETQQYGRHQSFFQPAGDDSYDGHPTAWVEASVGWVTAASKARKPKRAKARKASRKRVKAAADDATESALTTLFPALRNWRCIELTEGSVPDSVADAAISALPVPAGIDPKALKAWKDICNNDRFAVFPEPQTEDVLAAMQQSGIEDPVVRSGAYFVEYMCRHYGYNYSRQILTLVNFMAQQHGVESLRARGDAVYRTQPDLLYINVGDTYAPTLMCDQDPHGDGFRIGSWGDWLEQQEQDFAKQTPPRWGVGIDFCVSESASATEDDGLQVEEALDAALGRDVRELTDETGARYDWEYQGVLETQSRSDAEAKAAALLPRLTAEARQRGVTYSRLVMVPVQLRSFMDMDQHYAEVKTAQQQKRFCIDIGRQDSSSEWEYWAAWVQI